MNAKTTTLVGRAERGGGLQVVTFQAPPNPQELLADFVDVFRTGQSIPIPFFPRSSRDFVAKLKGATVETASPEEVRLACNAAERTFEGNQHTLGEGADRYVAQLFGDNSCLSAEFEPTAIQPGFQSFPVLSCRLLSPYLKFRSKENL